jgi:HEAT repeat protein
MECEKIIFDILSRLDVEYENPTQIGELEYECLTLLSQLDAECSEALMRTGQNLLDRSDQSEDIEYKFQLVLQALAKRHHPGALEINIAAVSSEKTRDKEAYIELLATFENPLAIPVLIHAIKVDDSTGEEEGWVRSKAIEVLRRLGAKEAASMIIPYIMDCAYRVRKAAIEFLVNLNIGEAVPIFVDQLSQEEDPINLEKLIFGLVSWKRTDTLPELRELLASDWVRNDQTLQKKVLDAISALEFIDR